MIFFCHNQIQLSLVDESCENAYKDIQCLKVNKITVTVFRIKKKIPVMKRVLVFM